MEGIKVPDRVFKNQPFLHIRVEEIIQNSKPIEIFYRVQETREAVYILYIYSWGYNKTQLWARALGYPSHNWDFEPVIVCIKKSGGKKYIYDWGHYVARTTTSRELRVTNGTHGYREAGKWGGFTFSRKIFKELTTERLKSMNRLLSDLPRIPFSSDLCLSQAYYHPEEVEKTGSFSTNTKRSPVPVRIRILGGIIVGLLVGIVFKNPIPGMLSGAATALLSSIL